MDGDRTTRCRGEVWGGDIEGMRQPPLRRSRGGAGGGGGRRLPTVGRRAVFLDLNGTLVLPLFVDDPKEYRVIPQSPEAVALLCSAGFVCPVITVQSRIEKGTYLEAEFREWFDSFRAALAEQGAFVLGPYICPHRYSTPCACKKPAGLLYRRAAAELIIDLASSFVIGDTREDLEAARILRCRGILVRTGWEVSPGIEALADHVATNLMAAAHWIMSGPTRP